MKAESAVFTGVQQPLTLFGLSPYLFIFNALGSVLVFCVFVALDILSLALIAAVISFVVIWCLLFRQTRRDPHFANLIFVAPGFWRGRSGCRLIAGQREPG